MSKKHTENRFFEVRALEEGKRTIVGTIPYNSRSEYMGFYEVLAPGCFSKSLRESKDIRLLLEHDDTKLLARTKNGSLRLTDDQYGLHFEADLPDTTDGNNLIECLRTSLLDQLSFGFIAINDKYEVVGGDEQRTILEARLLEISVVSNPAYAQTDCKLLRSLSSAFEGKENIDEDGQNAIKAEIEKLQALLPHEEEHREEPQPEPEPEDDPAEIQALQERLQKAQDIINSLEGTN